MTNTKTIKNKTLTSKQLDKKLSSITNLLARRNVVKKELPYLAVSVILMCIQDNKGVYANKLLKALKGDTELATIASDTLVDNGPFTLTDNNKLVFSTKDAKVINEEIEEKGEIKAYSDIRDSVEKDVIKATKSLKAAKKAAKPTDINVLEAMSRVFLRASKLEVLDQAYLDHMSAAHEAYTLVQEQEQQLAA